MIFDASGIVEDCYQISKDTVMVKISNLRLDQEAIQFFLTSKVTCKVEFKTECIAIRIPL